MNCKETMTGTAEVTWIKTETFDSQKTACCRHCQESFPGTGDLATHLMHTHSEQVYHCDKCDQVINSKTLFLEHTKLHEDNLKEEAVNLAEDSSSDECLPPFKEPHNKSRSISCEICLKKFKRDYHLKKHRATHKAESSAIVADEEVRNHITPVEEEGKSTRAKEVYRCELCSKNFKLKDSYKSHLRIHTGEKPFTCHICGKSFSHTGGLYYHLKHVHAGIKNHACDLCGRSFALKAAMEDHRRIHTGERPYVCHTCGKSFKTKASLYIHSKIHTDSFPHPCTYCDRRFRWRQQLLAHLTTHTGEKTHLCPICGKGFGVKNDLTRHKLVHSDAKPFACSLCGLSFGQKRYLKNHEKSRHGIRR